MGTAWSAVALASGRAADLAAQGPLLPRGAWVLPQGLTRSLTKGGAPGDTCQTPQGAELALCTEAPGRCGGTLSGVWLGFELAWDCSEATPSHGWDPSLEREP